MTHPRSAGPLRAGSAGPLRAGAPAPFRAGMSGSLLAGMPASLLAGMLALFLAGAGGTVPLAAQDVEDTAGIAAVEDTVGAPALGLREAVRSALDRSRDLRDARFELEIAEEQVSEVWGEVYPSVDLSARYNRNLSPQVSFFPARFFDPEASPEDQVAVQIGADNTWTSTVSVEQPLLSPRSFVAIPAAARFRQMQEEAVRGRAHEVVTRVRSTYYDLLLAREQVRLTENSLVRVRETLEETQALNRAGLASDFDVLRLEVELSNLEPNLLRARSEAAAARRALAVELDLDPREPLRVEGTLADLALDDPDDNTPANRVLLSFTGVEAPSAEPERDALVERAVEWNSTLRQAEIGSDLRHTELRLEQADYLPTVSLFGTYAVNSQQQGSPDFFRGPRAYTRNAGVVVTLPIFNGFQRDARVDQARAALRQAETRRDLSRDRTEQRVLDLLDEVDETRARARAQARAVEQARRAYEIATAEYGEGLASRLELTDSEVALRESEFNYAQAVYDFLTARARLDEAVGRVPGVDR